MNWFKKQSRLIKKYFDVRDRDVRWPPVLVMLAMLLVAAGMLYSR